MGIFTGYYESNTKHTLKCAHELLHTRSLKTSPVTLFRVKNMIQCVTEIVPFKSLRAFCIGLRCLHMKQTSIICMDYFLYHLLKRIWLDYSCYNWVDMQHL